MNQPRLVVQPSPQPSLTLVPTDPLAVYDIWDWVREGLLQAIRRTGGHSRPEDVYLLLRGGSAWLYLVMVEGQRVGFVILTREHDPDGPVMFIWCLWCEPHSVWETQAELYAELDKIARGIKAKRIRMWSPRRWWERQPFFKQVSAVYEHEVI